MPGGLNLQQHCCCEDFELLGRISYMEVLRERERERERGGIGM
jgi:hypothetical protein